VIDDNYGAGRDELVLATARLFGYASTSAQLRTVLLAGIQRLESKGLLLERDGLLVRA